MPKIKIAVAAPGGPVQETDTYYTYADVSQEDHDRLVEEGHAESGDTQQAKKTAEKQETTRGGQQVETATAKAPESRDYDSYTVEELKGQATEREIKTTGLKKADLIKELKKADRKK